MAANSRAPQKSAPKNSGRLTKIDKVPSGPSNRSKTASRSPNASVGGQNQRPSKQAMAYNAKVAGAGKKQNAQKGSTRRAK